MRAFVLLRRNRPLWRHVLVPILVSLVVAALLYALVLGIAFRMIDAGSESLNLLVRVVLAIAGLLAAGFLVTRIGIVIGSPWYERLSEDLEQLVLGGLPSSSPLSLRGALADLGRALGYEVRKLALVAAVALPALALNLVPVIGTFAATAVGLGLSATLACLDFFAGPLQRRRLPFRERLRFVRAQLPSSAGFGLACAGLVAIPFVGLLSIPLCVAAGTMFVCERMSRPDRGRGGT